jgi:hypothetical protein
MQIKLARAGVKLGYSDDFMQFSSFIRDCGVVE